MTPLWLTRTPTAALFTLALSLPITALAQYVWLDANGGKHYSDVPPPTTVPAKQILKTPGNSPLMPAKNPELQNPTQAQEGVNAGKAEAKPPKTNSEKNADFLKRKSEQAEKEKKSADDTKRLADKAKNCNRTRDYQRVLDSGQRISQTDKNGERAIMSDEQRAQEMRDTKQILAECKQ